MGKAQSLLVVAALLTQAGDCGNTVQHTVYDLSVQMRYLMVRRVMREKLGLYKVVRMKVRTFALAGDLGVT